MRPENPRGGLAQLIALAGILVAVGVCIALIVGWATDGNSSAPVAGEAPGAKPDVRVTRCDPIFGNGAPHQVESSSPAERSHACRLHLRWRPADLRP
jgi:hypothetical protein